MLDIKQAPARNGSAIPRQALESATKAARAGGMLALAVHPPGKPQGFVFSYVQYQLYREAAEAYGCGICLSADSLYHEVIETPLYVAWPPPHAPELARVGDKQIAWPLDHQVEAMRDALAAFAEGLSKGAELVGRLGGRVTVFEGWNLVENPRKMSKHVYGTLGLVAGRVRGLRLQTQELTRAELVFREQLKNALEKLRNPGAEL